MAELDLAAIDRHRFDGIPASKKLPVWREIPSYVITDATKLRSGAAVRSILDPACGDGEFLEGCRGSDRLLLGCDRRERPAALHAGIGYHRGFFQTLEEDRRFDLIWVSNLLEHLPDPEAVQDFLRLCAGRLQTGGVLTLMGPNIRY